MPGPLDRILAGTSGVADAHGASAAPHVAELVRTMLMLPDDVAVTVQQLNCRKPGCPPLETAIAVLTAPPRRWNIPCPLTAITDEMVARLLADNPDGGSHDPD